MRPLTAYHIFFQLEREYIIQSMSGPDADTTIHDNKSIVHGVPRKYRTTKLLPDWFAGPGKRTKRKHRKSHGKIGFLELSRVISKRWAVLESSDPETKQFVGRIAAGQLAEYKGEMKVYKEVISRMTTMTPPAVNVKPETPISKPSIAVRTVTEAANDTVAAMISPVNSIIGAMISPSTSPSPPATFFPVDAPSSSFAMPSSMMSSSMLSSMQFCQSIEFTPAFSLDTEFLEESTIQEEQIDYSICSKDNEGHYIPSPAFDNMSLSDGSFCDPLFELEDESAMDNSSKQRCVSPVAKNNMNVGVVSDKDFLNMMAC